jgi:hypothetical protein
MLMDAILKRSQVTTQTLGASLIVLASLLSQTAIAQRTSNQTLCYPNISWFAGTPPVIDGIVSTDRGWQGGFSFVDTRNDGTAGQGLATVTVQGVQDSNYVYLSFEAHKGSQQLMHDDTIVIGIDLSTSTVQNYIAIVITPIASDGQGTIQSYGPLPQPPPQPPPAGIDFQYYVNGTLTATPAWLTIPLTLPLTPPMPQNVAATSTTSNTDNYYDVEMRIPLASVPFPSTTPFGLYFDVISVFKNGFNSTATEAQWPENSNLQNGAPSNIPMPNLWGNGSLTGVCNGVDLPAGSIVDITAANPGGGTTLDLTGNNQFQVTPTNNTLSPSGQPVLAPQVTASFSIANFGFGNPWAPINSATDTYQCGTNSPNTPCDLQNPNATSFSTIWTVPGADKTTYEANPHQCIEVQLSAQPPSKDPSCVNQATTPWCNAATFIHNAAVQNMNFPGAPMSQGKMFRGIISQIGTTGFALPAGQEDQLYDFHVRTFQPSDFRKGGTQATRATSAAPGQALVWALHGYLHTKQFITIHKNTYELLNYVGSFGYGLTYANGQPAWRFQLFGENGSKVTKLGTDNYMYQMHVKQGGVGYINTTIEGDPQAGSGGPVTGGQSAGKFAAFLDLGANFPQGSLSSSFNNGFSLNAGLEYLATSHLSAEGIFGYHYLSAKAAGSEDIYQFSADAKYYLTTGNLRPFMNGGIGGYAFSPGSTHFGGNFGGGVLYTWSSHWGAQGSYNFHVVDTPISSSKFSTLQGGLRYVF